MLPGNKLVLPEELEEMVVTSSETSSEFTRCLQDFKEETEEQSMFRGVKRKRESQDDITQTAIADEQRDLIVRIGERTKKKDEERREDNQKLEQEVNMVKREVRRIEEETKRREDEAKVGLIDLGERVKVEISNLSGRLIIGETSLENTRNNVRINLENDRRAVEERIEMQDAKIQNLSKRNQELVDNLNRSNEEIAEGNRRVQGLNKRLEDLERQGESHYNRIKKLESKIDVMDEGDEMMQQINKIKDQLKIMRRSNDDKNERRGTGSQVRDSKIEVRRIDYKELVKSIHDFKTKKRMIGQIKATLEMYDLNMVEEQEFLKRIVLQKFNYQKMINIQEKMKNKKYNITNLKEVMDTMFFDTYDSQHQEKQEREYKLKIDTLNGFMDSIIEFERLIEGRTEHGLEVLGDEAKKNLLMYAVERVASSDTEAQIDAMTMDKDYNGYLTMVKKILTQRIKFKEKKKGKFEKDDEDINYFQNWNNGKKGSKKGKGKANGKKGKSKFSRFNKGDSKGKKGYGNYGKGSNKGYGKWNFENNKKGNAYQLELEDKQEEGSNENGQENKVEEEWTGMENEWYEDEIEWNEGDWSEEVNQWEIEEEDSLL